MSEIRSRKSQSSRKKDEIPRKKNQTSPAKDDSRLGILTVVTVAVCIIGMVAMGYIYANYMSTLHENWMWFSNIKILMTFNTGLIESTGSHYMDPADIPFRQERRKEIINQLRQSNAHVICLQEVWIGEDADKIIDDLKPKFPFSFSALHNASGSLPMDGMDSEPACEPSALQSFLSCIFGLCPDSKNLVDYIACGLVPCISEFLVLGQECWTCLWVSGPNFTLIGQRCSGTGSGPFQTINPSGLLLLSTTEMDNLQYVDYHPNTREMAERGYIQADVSQIGEIICTHAAANMPDYIEFELMGDGFTSYEQQSQFEMNTLVREFSSREKVIILGDFNTGPALTPNIEADMPGNYALLTVAFKHHLLSMCTFCNSTENAYNGDKPSVVIDHIFYKGYNYQSSTRVLDGNLVKGQPMSDHYGLIQRFTQL